MNILFFLTPKSEVIYIDEHATVRTGLQTIQSNTYTALPLIAESGEYLGTITEGDFLKSFRNISTGAPVDNLDENVMTLPRAFKYEPVSVNADMEHLFTKAINQNFVPVIDDNGKFIGIITRKDLIQHMYDRCKEHDLI